MIEEKYQDGKKQKPGYVGQVIPPSLVLFDDSSLQTTMDLLKYCGQPAFRTIRLSNSMKTNPHGEKVIQTISVQCEADGNYDKFEEFIRLWRVEFLENMKPKYLPRGWKVDHKMQRTFGEMSIFGKD